AGDSARAGADAEALGAPLARLAQATQSHGRLADLAARNAGTLDTLPRDDVLAVPEPKQAVTSADLERLALDVPGARILRTRAFSGAAPALPGLPVPATVTLVITPGLPRARPAPSANLIRRVDRYLQPRRGMGTRLRVIGPVYAERSVSATLRVHP